MANYCKETKLLQSVLGIVIMVYYNCFNRTPMVKEGNQTDTKILKSDLIVRSIIFTELSRTYLRLKGEKGFEKRENIAYHNLTFLMKVSWSLIDKLLWRQHCLKILIKQL